MEQVMGLDHVIARRALSRAAAGAEAPRPDPGAMDRAVTRPWLTARRIAAILLAAASLSIAAYGYVTYGLSRRVGVEAERLTLSPVERATFHDFIPLTGGVQPEKTVFLDIPQSGQVVERLVEEGALVSEGQPIARLRNTALTCRSAGSSSSSPRRSTRSTRRRCRSTIRACPAVSRWIRSMPRSPPPN
jgi:hypothetical protein